MKWKLAVAGGLMLLASQGALAQFSSTITLTNDYDFRGFSQSAKDPAVQASLDYGFANGFAVGVWASNVDFEPADGDIEVDYYGSYTGEINETTSWSIGATYYSYPGSDDLLDYPEYYVGFDVGDFGFKQWYSNDLYDSGESGMYTEGNATFALPQDFSLLLHLGYSWGDLWENSFDEGGLGGELFDYAIGVGYDINNFSLVLKYLGTDASGEQKVTDDVGNNEGRVVFLVSTTLPWGNE
jgi:uncharacterized protein (TIGR02001 family)